MVIGVHGEHTVHVQKLVVEASKNDTGNVTTQPLLMVVPNVLVQTEVSAIVQLIDVQSTVNGHHGEVSVDAMLNVEEGLKKDIDRVLLHHRGMVDDIVLDIQGISTTVTTTHASSMVTGVNGAHTVIVPLIVMAERRRDIGIVTVLHQVMVVSDVLVITKKLLNVTKTDVQSTANGEHGVDLHRATSNAVVVLLRERDRVIALNHNLVDDHVMDHHQTNDLATHKDAKWMATGELTHRTENVLPVVEEVFKRSSDIVTTLRLLMVVQIVQDIQRWFVFVT